MPSVSLGERQKVNDTLKRCGFGGLEDPTILDQLAFVIHGHDHFRGILMSVTEQERHIAYQALAPRVRFKAKPLEEYERETKLKAEREQWDIYDGTPFPKPFKPASDLASMAEKAIQDSEAKGTLTLVCKRCTREQVYPAKNKEDGWHDAQLDGWRQTKFEETICPSCMKNR